MTYEELKSDVLALGFVDTLESENHLLLAANRALHLIANDFPTQKSLCLHREYCKPIRTLKRVGRDGVFACRNERLAFCYRLSDGEIRFGVQRLTLPESGVHRFVASADGVLSTHGGAEIFELCIYGEDAALTGCECALPFVCYEVDDYASDALRISGVPTDAYGAEITEARTEGRRVLIPRAYDGTFFIHYEKCAQPITAPEGELEIPRECLSLFPLLVCGYLWLDDEPDRAQYYMALYREGRNLLRERKPSRTQRLNTDTMGWT